MERRQALNTPSTALKKGRPKSFLSWIFHNNSVPVSDETEDEAKLEVKDRHRINTSFSSPTTSGPYTHSSIEATVSNYGNHSDIEIPNRRQSHLYTPFHGTVPDDYKRRSCYLAPSDANVSSASLTRSATWQPSTSTTAATNDHVLLGSDIIPDRRTSRNYAANPEIQARLNAMLNSDRTAYLSTVLQSNHREGSGSSHVQRRSTTPSNTMS